MPRPGEPGLHSLLTRQLEQLGLEATACPASPQRWTELLERVSRSYRQADEDRSVREGSLDVASADMTQLIEELSANNAVLSAEVVQRRQMETVLRSNEERTQLIVESALDAFVSIDARGKVIQWNVQAEKLFGHSKAEALGASLAELIVPPAFRHAHQEAIRRFSATGEAPMLNKRVELIALRRDGTEFPIELLAWRTLLGLEHCFNGIIRDVSDHRRLEVELRQSQKLEAVGQLASGIAHEINTPIQFIGDNTQFLKTAFESYHELINQYHLLLQGLAANEFGVATFAALASRAEADADVEYLQKEVPNAVNQALEGVERVSGLVRAMKEFSHPGVREKAPTDINRAIENTVAVTRNEWKYVSDLTTELDASLPLVPCIAADFSQALLNLVVNAAHAIEDRVGSSGTKGKIVIRTTHADGWARVSVRDTGCGIPENIRARVFDPFFTTKAVGRGTGQGLTIARSNIVEKLGGTMHFESELGEGTTFHIAIPLDVPDAASPPALESAYATTAR